jgi:heme exporter protein D
MTLLAGFAGKYAPFIWPAYGVCAMLFAWMVVDTLARARHWRERAERPDDDTDGD